MTIGISKESLETKLTQYFASSGVDVVTPEHWVLINLIASCAELNPWLQIDENTQKDRGLLLYDGYNQFIGFLNEYGKYEINSGSIIKPTHYKELPEDPK